MRQVHEERRDVVDCKTEHGSGPMVAWVGGALACKCRPRSALFRRIVRFLTPNALVEAGAGAAGNRVRRPVVTRQNADDDQDLTVVIDGMRERAAVASRTMCGSPRIARESVVVSILYTGTELPPACPTGHRHK